uniref:Matrix metallopeptidase 19 n=1 Tax=Petromyzon marinus TaxID=7757 RepID=S4RAE6_PETMA
SGGRWRKTTLAYHFLNLTPDLKGNEVKKIIARAFHEWSRVTPLRFYETPTSPKADIHIQFSRLQHGDFAPFDGPGRVLAHAYFPEDGRAHFDEDEQWSEGTAQGINLHIVATHEFGHLLGLGHSKEQAALMAPFYMGYRPKFRLHADDIAGIQSLYGTRLGKRHHTATRRVAQPAPPPRSRARWMPHGRREDEGAERPTRSPIPHDVPDPCTAQLDAITMGPDGRTYAFSGAYCWVVTDTGVQQGYPVATSSLWSGLPASLSAAAHSKHTGHTFFFAGDKYWRYRGFASDPGYPKMMSSTGLPSNVDAALMFRDRIYVFKGGEYWRWNEYHEQAVHGYPRKMATTWRGVPSSPDAALTWGNGHSFFFKDGRYWRINSHSRRTEPGYPRDTAAVWMGCSRSLKQHDVVWDDV